MGLREELRTALGTIAASVHETAHTLRYGEDECGSVVQASSRDFAEPLSDNEPMEATRFIASGADFPTLDEGAAVELDGRLRVVTSLRSDPIGATLTVGLSAEFEKFLASYGGTRREKDRVRKFTHPISLLAIRTADPPPNLSDAPAFSCDQSWLACLAAGAWPETFPPQTGDSIEFTDPKRPWETLHLKVASVVQHAGWWMLRARPRGAHDVGPRRGHRHRRPCSCPVDAR